MTTYPHTAALMKRGTDFLGCETAIMCGAMSWVSERNLVAAISNAGGFGVIACGESLFSACEIESDDLDSGVGAQRDNVVRQFNAGQLLDFGRRQADVFF